MMEAKTYLRLIEEGKGDGLMYVGECFFEDEHCSICEAHRESTFFQTHHAFEDHPEEAIKIVNLYEKLSAIHCRECDRQRSLSESLFMKTELCNACETLFRMNFVKDVKDNGVEWTTKDNAAEQMNIMRWEVTDLRAKISNMERKLDERYATHFEERNSDKERDSEHHETVKKNYEDQKTFNVVVMCMLTIVSVLLVSKMAGWW